MPVIDEYEEFIRRREIRENEQNEATVAERQAKQHNHQKLRDALKTQPEKSPRIFKPSEVTEHELELSGNYFVGGWRQMMGRIGLIVKDTIDVLHLLPFKSFTVIIDDSAVRRDLKDDKERLMGNFDIEYSIDGETTIIMLGLFKAYIDTKYIERNKKRMKEHLLYKVRLQILKATIDHITGMNKTE